MMRRPSPPRISRSSPPRRPPPPRSRTRRSPSGDDVKIVNWGAPGSGASLRPSRSDRPTEPPRSRSRSREKRVRVSGDHDRHRERDREPARDSRDTRDNRGDNRDHRDSRGTRDTRDRDRDLLRNTSHHRLNEVKQKLDQTTKPLSFELQSYQQQSFGGSSRFESLSSSRFDNTPNRHLMTSNEESFVDPSDFHQNFAPTPLVPPLNVHSSQLKFNAPEPLPLMGTNNGNRSVSLSVAKKSPKVEKEDERIARLEKLVEKLVETQTSSVAPKNSNVGDVGSPFQSQNEPDIFNSKELIPSNTKFTTSMWLNSLHDECLDRGFDEKTCIQYVKSKMTGIVKAWFKTVEGYDFTWPELKLLITKTFPDNVDFANTLRMLVDREKIVEETITQYFFSKMYLCEACKITGENAVSCLIDGLTNPFMKQDIRSCNFLTPEVLYSEYLSKYPEREIRDRIEREVETYQDFPPPDALMERQRMDYHLDLPPRDMRGQSLREGGLRAPPLRGSRPTRIEKCETCKKMGHSAVDCRHAPICYKCKERGHIRAKCPHFVGLLTSPEGKIPFMTMCEIRGKLLMGQIDTGSSTNIIKETMATNLGLKISKCDETLTGYGGAKIKVHGIAEAVLKIDNVEMYSSLMVVQDDFQDFPLIIGREFLSQLGTEVVIHGGHLRFFKNVRPTVGQLVQEDL